MNVVLSDLDTYVFKRQQTFPFKKEKHERYIIILKQRQFWTPRWQNLSGPLSWERAYSLLRPKFCSLGVTPSLLISVLLALPPGLCFVHHIPWLLLKKWLILPPEWQFELFKSLLIQVGDTLTCVPNLKFLWVFCVSDCSLLHTPNTTFIQSFLRHLSTLSLLFWH